jgi:hypothetical protein
MDILDKEVQRRDRQKEDERFFLGVKLGMGMGKEKKGD